MDATSSEAKIDLWHLAVSHYNEKVRWALDYKGLPWRSHLPMPGAPHMLIALWLTRGRNSTFPVLRLDGRAVGDSTAIIAALEERFPDPPLYPADPEQRQRALGLEDFFDEEVAPHVRLLAFHELQKDPVAFNEFAARFAPKPMARLGSISGIYGRAFLRLRYRVHDPEAAELARTRIAAGMDRLDQELGDGDYLVGGAFSVADLTAAAVFYPLVIPPGTPIAGQQLPHAYEEFRARFADRRGYRWVEEMFARHRDPRPAAERTAAAA
jgi:glutathione S-transferase